MGLRGQIFALVYDRQMAKAEQAGLGALRAELLARARGHVLEIGAGTGANLSYYGPQVQSLTLTEPEPPMMRRLQRRAGLEREVTVVRAPAEELPFDDNSFDVVVSTLVLCGVEDQPRALREVRRVLRPEGHLLFLEHVRAQDPSLARLQDRMNGVNRFLVGCDCNRPTLATIEAAGFSVTWLEQTTVPKAPKFVRPAILGSATVSAAVTATHLAEDPVL